jgi:hypothetical protein
MLKGRATRRRNDLRTRKRREGMPAPGAWGIVQTRQAMVVVPPSPLAHHTVRAAHLAANVHVRRGVSASAALKIIWARKASDCGVEWARAKAWRSIRAFCDKMMRGAKGVGMVTLLAKRLRKFIVPICSLSHIFHKLISGYSL